jgi:release factor glutamine methyltransferase
MCTGSGCIAIALAKSIPSARLTASDISRSALCLAAKNAEIHDVAARISLICGDLFEPVAALSPPVLFHAIVCNPPYIVADQISSLMPEVSAHEPRLALDGGPDGLAFYRRIAEQAGDFLISGGALIVETAFDQTQAVEQMLLAQGVFHDSQIIRDLAGHPRCVLVRKAVGR